MDIRVVPVLDLRGTDLDAWSDIQRATCALDSPFFRPEFARVASRLWPYTKVAIAEEDGKAVGFLPFEPAGRAAVPLGSAVNDFHGVIARTPTSAPLDTLLRGADLSSYSFDHLAEATTGFAEHVFVRANSAYLDLREGVPAYEQGLRRKGSNLLAEFRRKRRKLEREVGRIEFRLDDPAEETFAALVEWKAAQNARSHVAPITTTPWFRQLGQVLREEAGPDFQPLMTSLYAGDRRIAVHLGLRSRGVLHWWFPAYDAAYSRYSPGLLLLLLSLWPLTEDGVYRIDLGKGTMEWKDRAKSADRLVGEGCVARRRATVWARRQYFLLRDRVRSSARLRLLAHRVDRWMTLTRLRLGFDR